MMNVQKMLASQQRFLSFCLHGGFGVFSGVFMALLDSEESSNFIKYYVLTEVI